MLEEFCAIVRRGDFAAARALALAGDWVVELPLEDVERVRDGLEYLAMLDTLKAEVGR